MKSSAVKCYGLLGTCKIRGFSMMSNSKIQKSHYNQYPSLHRSWGTILDSTKFTCRGRMVGRRHSTNSHKELGHISKTWFVLRLRPAPSPTVTYTVYPAYLYNKSHFICYYHPLRPGRSTFFPTGVYILRSLSLLIIKLH